MLLDGLAADMPREKRAQQRASEALRSLVFSTIEAGTNRLDGQLERGEP
jgi:hypothetical protein